MIYEIVPTYLSPSNQTGALLFIAQLDHLVQIFEIKDIKNNFW